VIEKSTTKSTKPSAQWTHDNMSNAATIFSSLHWWMEYQVYII